MEVVVVFVVVFFVEAAINTRKAIQVISPSNFDEKHFGGSSTRSENVESIV